MHNRLEENIYPFLESVRLQDGVLRNLEYHQDRFERTRREVLRCWDHPLLSEFIHVPGKNTEGIFKCRVHYGKEIGKIEIESYSRKTIRTLKLVFSDSISYGYKYLDRGELERLYDMRGGCDDILVVKNGMITDSFYANVALWDGRTWYTPNAPLLPGTMRARLLQKGTLRERSIRTGDLSLFTRIRLVNALNSLEEANDIPVEAIVF